jgi:hypothetical protein
MSKFWKREEPLERELRTAFEPRDGFEDGLAERVRKTSATPRYARASRASFATAVAVFMLGSFASFGGVSLAAAGAKETVRAVAHVTVDQKPIHRRITSASTEYPKTTKVSPVKIVKAKPKHHVKTKPTNLRQTKTAGTLPFTGISLLATVLVSLLFLAAGATLRRLGTSPSRS